MGSGDIWQAVGDGCVRRDLVCLHLVGHLTPVQSAKLVRLQREMRQSGWDDSNWAPHENVPDRLSDPLASEERFPPELALFAHAVGCHFATSREATIRTGVGNAPKRMEY